MAQRFELGRLCTVIQGTTIDRFRDHEGATIKPIYIRNLNSLELGGDYESYKVDKEKVASYRAEPNQVVIGLPGYPFKASVVPKGDNNWIATSNVAILKFKDQPSSSIPNVNPYYLAGFLRSDYFSQLIRAEFARADAVSIGVKTLRTLEIPLPSNEQQKAFATAFEAHDKYVATLREVADLRAQRLELQLNSTLGEAIVTE